MTMSLAEDLGDIYNDIKKGTSLISLDTENAIASGLFYFQDSFGHWGHHCITAMRAIHSLRFEPKMEEDIVQDILNSGS